MKKVTYMNMLDTSATNTQTATITRTHATTRAAYVTSAWYAAYIPLHLYLALGGTAILPAFAPTVATFPQLRMANWIASLGLGVGAVLALALARPWGRRIPRSILLAATWLGCVVPAAHGIYGIVNRVSVITGISTLNAQAFTLPKDVWVLWDLLVFEPWFLFAGILFGASGWFFLSAPRDRQVWSVFCILGTLAALGSALLHVKVG